MVNNPRRSLDTVGWKDTRRKYDIDKKIGLVVGLLVVFMILNSIVGFLVYPLIINLFGSDGLADFNMNQFLISIGIFILTVLGNLVIAIWLNVEAKRLKRDRLVWTVFPLFFGIVAAMLFYLIEIYNELIYLRKDMKRLLR